MLRLILLYPFGLIYGSVAAARRWYFESSGKRKKASVHTIGIGNITVGGTGKTPMTILLAELLSYDKKIAILSRGYGRTTKGFLEVLPESDFRQSGDEPLEIAEAVDGVRVFVSESRLNGISEIQKAMPDCNLVILDDAWQHLPLQCDKYVLLCDYSRPFFQDFPMPAGNLREFKTAATGADAIVVTKCPENLSLEEALQISSRLNRYTPKVYFASYVAECGWPEAHGKIEEKSPVVVISALADNGAFQAQVSKKYHVCETVSYRDHHSFTKENLSDWNRLVHEHSAAGIITTRKDFMRIKPWLDQVHVPINFYFTRPKFLFNAEDDFIRILF